MKIKVYLYVLTDAKGNQSFDVVKDSSDNICIGGYNKNGKYQQFEYEGYHSWRWAEDMGFILESFEKEFDIELKTKIESCAWCGNKFAQKDNYGMRVFACSDVCLNKLTGKENE